MGVNNFDVVDGVLHGTGGEQRNQGSLKLKRRGEEYTYMHVYVYHIYDHD